MRGFWHNSVLGINRRNLDYLFALNPRDRFPLADDKLVCKKLLQEAGLPVPRTLAVVRQRAEINGVVELLQQQPAFVVKPARGFGGQGVMLLERRDSAWWSSRATRVPDDEVVFHMAGILSGMFSLDRLEDCALVEERLAELPLLSDVHGSWGVSDLRVIVAESQPVMAMLRLPSRSSGGSANLHRGGVGVGIDLETGHTTFGVSGDRPIDAHPDSGVPVAGIAIPGWRDVLDICCPTNRVFGLGYLGVDIVLDANRGPVILEVNVRPGLAVQLANRIGLRDPLRERSA